MYIEVMKSKIHRATVTQADLNYIGSITIDEDLMDAVNIIENEKVDIYDVTNGNRLHTYAIKGKRGSGIIASYCSMEFEEAKKHKPYIIFPDKDNKI